jgi:hypothetical protein
VEAGGIPFSGAGASDFIDLVSILVLFAAAKAPPAKIKAINKDTTKTAASLFIIFYSFQVKLLENN